MLVSGVSGVWSLWHKEGMEKKVGGDKDDGNGEEARSEANMKKHLKERQMPLAQITCLTSCTGTQPF